MKAEAANTTARNAIAEEEVAPEKIPARVLVRPGWYAQVAAPSSKEQAANIAGQLRASGFPVTVEQAEVRGQRYFRVLVGPEENKVYAQRLLVQLRRESVIKGDPFIKLVK